MVSKVNVQMNTNISKSLVSTIDHWPSIVLANIHFPEYNY